MRATRSCRRCGVSLDDASSYCSRCGTRQGSPHRLEDRSASPAGLAPGWYADPFGQSRHRYFDGDIWTDRVHDRDYGRDLLTLDHLERARSAWRATWGSLALTLGGLAVAFGLSLLLVLPYWLLGRPGGTVAAILLSETGLWSGLLATCLLTSRRYGTGRLRADFRVRFRPVDVAIGLGAALVARAVSAAAITPLIAAHHVVTNPDAALYSIDRLGWLGWLFLGVVTCVGAPFVEELFFRGLLQGQLTERFGPWIAVAFTSVVFGAAHFANDPGFAGVVLAVSVGSAGVVLGVVRHLSGRLGASMATHVSFNAIALVLLAALGTGHS